MANFNEQDHPREEDGKFAPKGGESAAGKGEDKKPKGQNNGFTGWRNMTAAQRYNAKADKIFDRKKMLNDAQAKYLSKLGVSDDEIEKLKQDDKLQIKLIELGKEDEFFKNYNFDTGELKEEPTQGGRFV